MTSTWTLCLLTACKQGAKTSAGTVMIMFCRICMQLHDWHWMSLIWKIIIHCDIWDSFKINQLVLCPMQWLQYSCWNNAIFSCSKVKTWKCHEIYIMYHPNLLFTSHYFDLIEQIKPDKPELHYPLNSIYVIKHIGTTSLNKTWNGVK